MKRYLKVSSFQNDYLFRASSKSIVFRIHMTYAAELILFMLLLFSYLASPIWCLPMLESANLCFATSWTVSAVIAPLIYYYLYRFRWNLVRGLKSEPLIVRKIPFIVRWYSIIFQILVLAFVCWTFSLPIVIIMISLGVFLFLVKALIFINMIRAAEERTSESLPEGTP